MNRHITNIRSLKRLRPQALLLFFILWLTSAIVQMMALPSLAQEFEPPDRGLPGRREGGGTRGDTRGDTTAGTRGCLTQPMIALMPTNNKGSTLAAYPTFFWYLPENPATMAEFVLLDSANQEIYKTLLPVSQKSGVIRLSLPTDQSVPALEVGKTYQWYFSLICDPLDGSANPFTSGLIERIAPDAELTQALAAATPEQQARIYAEAGLWYEAVATLAKLREQEPNNVALLNAWQTLLQSVGLEQVANQPLLPE